MQITGKILLNSAENILKDRQQEHRAPHSTGKGEKQAASSPANIAASHLPESRLIKLQNDLKSLQSEYSREQVRYDYLQNRPGEISEQLSYENRPLFPEYPKGLDQEAQEALKQNTAYNLKRLVDSLRSIQVEMENLYALSFESPQGAVANLSSLVTGNSIKDLDPERVAHLTRS